MTILSQYGRGLKITGATLQADIGTGANQVAQGSLLPGAAPIDTTGATDGQGLAYSSAAGKYLPAAGVGGVLAFVSANSNDLTIAPVRSTNYSGGTVVSATQKSASFTANQNVSRYEITATGVVCTLDSALPNGVTFEFWDCTGNANPNFTLTPNGGKLINGQASIVITSQYFGRVVKRDSDGSGNWTMAV